ncbi:flagellar basal body P-ring formation chaperone FlgA [Thiovibrio sp. JS02]
MMRKTAWLPLVALLICLFFPFPVGAAEKTTTIGLAELETIFSNIVLENSPFPAEDTRIANFTARPFNLTLPAGNLDYRVNQRPADGKPGRKSVLVTFLADGRDAGQVRMNGDLQLYSDVVCTSKRLARNEIITEDAITVVRQDISMLDSGIVRDPAQVLGQKLKTSLRAGAVLYSQLIDAPPLVSRGEMVTIMAKSKTVRITAPGEAKNTGALGEVVKVKNLMSRREIYARVAGAGVVETEF